MDHLIAHEFTHIMQFKVLYGGFWRSPKLVKGLSGLVPLWIMEGQAEHISHKVLNRPWSSYDRMILRDAVLNKNLHNLRELHNFNALYPDTFLAYKESHSAIDYLVKTEGEKVNFRLLKSLRNNIDPTKAFELTVKEFSGLKDFNDRWQADLKKRVKKFSKELKAVEESCDLIINDEYNATDPAYAGNNSFYYVSDRWGRNEIYFYDGKKSRTVLKDYFGSNVKMLQRGRRNDRAIDYSNVNSKLVFLAKDVNEIILCIYDTKNKELKEIGLGDIKEARSVSISEDGTKILFTGLNAGSRGIYIYDLKKGNFNKIEESSSVDYAPVFFPSGDKVLAVSERNYNNDLRVIDLNSSTSKWLTETPENEIFPVIDSDSEKIYYSCDKDHVYNIFSLKDNSDTPNKKTDIKTGIFYLETAGAGDMLASVYHDGSYKIGKFKVNKGSYSISLKREYLKDSSTVTLTSEDIKKKDYKFDFSTDFFLPSFLYSTDIGFVGGGYYMASDMLGRHNFNVYGWAWPGMHNASITYTLTKWRPDIYLSAVSNDNKYYYRASDDEIYSVNETGRAVTAGVSYPLNNFNALGLWTTAASENTEDKGEDSKEHETETGFGLGYNRNTTSIEPFMPLKGNALNLSVYFARPWEKFSREFNTYKATAKRYTPITKKVNLSNRISYARSEGKDKNIFKLDPSYRSSGNYFYRLRGYKRGAFKGNNSASLSTEIRYMLFPDLKWHIYFMWPDINIDSLSFKAFTDIGTCWYDGKDPSDLDSWGKSWGAGLKLNIYLIQMVPAYFDIQFARPYDKYDWKVYIELGSGYLKW